jgi:hypothetical protein
MVEISIFEIIELGAPPRNNWYNVYSSVLFEEANTGFQFGYRNKGPQ